MLPSPVELSDWGVPAGTLAYATGVALACAERAGPAVAVSALGVAIQLYLPYVMAAAYHAPPPPPPPAPRAAPGGGWLAADLGAVDDRDRFETLLSTLPAGADAAMVAAAAQEWRLPVCDYRRRSSGHAGSATADQDPRPPSGPATHLSGCTILDLTAMWAGPLATWLMQGLGARVHKVEPDARPDGTRAITGGGIYPDGRQVRPGEDSAVWHALNHGKLRLALDLTQPPDRSELIERAGCADVVIDSFSPRVLANFGLDPTRMATAWISMPAFPPGPHRAWVAYGTGIHAASGLGDQEDGTFTSPSVAYPDPVAGFTAAWTLLSILSDGGSGHHEVALASALAPLAARAGPVTPGRPPGLRLFEAGLESGEFLRLEVAGRRLDHPVGPFRNQPALAGNRPK